MDLLIEALAGQLTLDGDGIAVWLVERVPLVLIRFLLHSLHAIQITETIAFYRNSQRCG